MLAERDEMLTTAPCPTVSTIWRAASLVSVNGAVTLKANVRAMNPSLVSKAARGIAPPALLTRMSRRPNSSTARVDQALAGLGVGHVGRHDQGPAAQVLDVPGDLLQVGHRPRRQDHVGAGLGQPDGDPPPDPEPGAGDDRHPPGDGEAVEDHAGPCVDAPRRSRCTPRAARPATRGISR